MSRAYYNEIDPYAAQWLRNLIGAGLIADGDVDERSIIDVRSSDLAGYRQCHFFAGIGVWSYALRLAGFGDDRPVWSGSCPCQPFSAAGKGDGYEDERHLWPHWHRLIRECRPPTIFGEQVDAAIRTGWLDDVCLSLESLGYAVGAVDFPACSVGAPHIRQRLYFVVESECGAAERQRFDVGSATRGLEGEAREWQRLRPDARNGGVALALAATNGFWRDAVWIPCRDGKARAVKPGTFPLVNGAPSRVGRLRAYGNAICAAQAAEFIGAYCESN